MTRPDTQSPVTSSTTATAAAVCGAPVAEEMVIGSRSPLSPPHEERTRAMAAPEQMRDRARIPTTVPRSGACCQKLGQKLPVSEVGGKGVRDRLEEDEE